MHSKLAILFLALFCTACATTAPRTKHFLLGQNLGPLPTPSLEEGAPNVALARLSVAGFLDQAGVVYQIGPNEVRVAARNLWAEPLPEQLQRALYDEITRQTKAVTVFQSASAAPVRSVRLSLEFAGFHGRYDGQAVVAGLWTLADRQNQPLLRQPFKYEIALGSDGYPELVAALAQGLDALAADIAATLDRFAGSQTAASPE